jgi:hypothetical protein
MCGLSYTKAVFAIIIHKKQSRKLQAKHRMIRSIWLPGNRSHRVERMSIARSPDRQCHRQMSAGDLATAKVLARKPSVGVLSQEPGEVEKEADRQE